MRNLQKTLDAGSITDVEYTLLSKAGTRIPVQLSASAVLDDAGAPAGFVAIVRDMTAWKRAEREIVGLNRDLEDRIAEREGSTFYFSLPLA